MLSNKKIVCPNNLITVAKKAGTVNAAIVNAGEIFPMESVNKAVQQNLINPIFIGNEIEIKKHAKKLQKSSFERGRNGTEHDHEYEWNMAMNMNVTWPRT